MDVMNLSNLHPSPGARTEKRRLGRGHGSGRGKTAGRGTKGQKARTGGGVRAYFAGGQNAFAGMPVKRGLHNKQPPRVRPVAINVGELAAFPAGAEVNRAALLDAGLIGKNDRKVKILGEGELRRPLTVTATAFSAGAREKIEAAGGQAIVEGTAPAAGA
jgi:large subunit ribosomal protein L15